MIGERRQDLVGAHGRHERVVGEADAHDDGVAGERPRLLRLGVAVGARSRFLGRVLLADEDLQAADERLRVEVLDAVCVDRVDRGLERVEALEHDVDDRPVERGLPLAQKLEDVLHLVRERRDGGVAHRRGHPLERVRAAEDLVDRVAVGGVFLDADDGEVERLEVLARLREEHGEVLGRVHVHATFR